MSATALTAGRVLDARVAAVEPYGIYLTCDGNEILVLIPEVSWQNAVRDCREFAEAGDVLPVKILRFVPERSQYLGSIKQAKPEENPWNDPALQTIGSEWTGTVRREISSSSDSSQTFGYLVELVPGVSGLLRTEEDRLPLHVGDEVDVKVKRIDSDQQQIELERR